MCATHDKARIAGTGYGGDRVTFFAQYQYFLLKHSQTNWFSWCTRSRKDVVMVTHYGCDRSDKLSRHDFRHQIMLISFSNNGGKMWTRLIDLFHIHFFQTRYTAQLTKPPSFAQFRQIYFEDFAYSLVVLVYVCVSVNDILRDLDLNFQDHKLETFISRKPWILSQKYVIRLLQRLIFAIEWHHCASNIFLLLIKRLLLGDALATITDNMYLSAVTRIWF